MVIQIDDAGTGDLVGPAVIGFRRMETGEMIFKEIGLQHFCEPLWSQKSPTVETRRIVQETLAEWKVAKEECIQLCRGNVFDQAREWLKQAGYTCQDFLIEGPLQDAVEQWVVDKLRSIGVDDPKLTIESGKDRFFVLFRWVARNPVEREKYVKTGFKAWGKKWREQAFNPRKKKTPNLQHAVNTSRTPQNPPATNSNHDGIHSHKSEVNILKRNAITNPDEESRPIRAKLNLNSNSVQHSEYRGEPRVQ